MKKTYKLNEIVRNAVEKSAFYRELYKNIDVDNFKIEELPFAEQDAFWDACSGSENKVLTDKFHDGIIFKSGGTTGNPKFSVFTKEEWETFTRFFGEGMDHVGLKEGDRVANLFYAGELYASFVFIMKSLDYARTPVLQFPVAGATSVEAMVKTIREFNVNVLCGVPTTFMNMTAWLKERGETLKLDRILYGGESLYEDQIVRIEETIPGVKCQSIGYASVDGGHLGYVDSDCKKSEHKVFEGSIMEIVDPETGKVIKDRGVKGKLVYTNLTRKLMPIIRYPVGDEAMWTGEDKFLLLGRSDEGARIGPVTVNRDDVIHILEKSRWHEHFLNFQLLINRFEGKDQLTIALSVEENSQNNKKEIKDDLISIFLKERPMFVEAVELGHIAPLEIKICRDGELEKNPRTGKLKLVLDNRLK